MDHRGRCEFGRSAARLLTLTAAVGVLVAVLARNGSILVQQCVPAEGTAGWLGLRLALLRVDAVCPTGELAVGGEGRQVLSVVIMVAVPLLLGHLVGLALSLGLLARLGGLLRALGAIVAVVPGLLDHAPSTYPVLRLAGAARTTVVLVARPGSESLSRRGPPTLQLA